MSANFTPEKEDLKILTPFKMQVLTNFPYIEADFDALTNYQLLCKIVEYLNNVIAETNEVTEQTLSLYNAYVALQDYVNDEIGDFETTVNNRVDGLETYMNNYFNNLDVQQEINNKLDAMATDGSLTALISGYVDPIYQAYESEINASIGNIQNQVNVINNKVNTATSGSPAGVYATVSDLTTADPDHSKIYVVTADGKWYYYNTSSSTWTIGGTYQATEISDNDMARINKAYSEALNTKIEDLSGDYQYYISSSSPYSQVNSDQNRTSEFIICQGYEKIKYKSVISNIGFELLFYDRNKDLIPESCVIGTDSFSIKTVNVPNNAFYTRFTCYGESQYSTAWLELYTENSNIEKTNENIIDIANNLEDINHLKKLEVITVKPTIDGYIKYSNGSVVNDPVTYDLHTDYIKVNGYNKIKYKTSISSVGCELAFFDKDKNYIQSDSIQGTNSIRERIISIPDNVFYVILSKYSEDTSIYITLFYDSYNFKTPLLNKNVLIFGDSITQSTSVTVNNDYQTTAYSWDNNPSPKKWAWLINRYLTCKEVRCYALNQARYATVDIGIDNKRLYIHNQVRIAINDKNNPNNVFSENTFNPDIVIFAAGTNQTSTVGTYETAMNKTIYEEDNETIDYDATLENLDLTVDIEAARYCYMKIKHEWPMAQIYVVLPIQSMGRNQEDSAMNINLRKLALRYGAIVIDGTDNGIVLEDNVYQGSGVTLYDGLHPNQNGQYLMFRQIYKSIESNYFDYNYLD